MFCSHPAPDPNPTALCNGGEAENGAGEVPCPTSLQRATRDALAEPRPGPEAAGCPAPLCQLCPSPAGSVRFARRSTASHPTITGQKFAPRDSTSMTTMILKRPDDLIPCVWHSAVTRAAATPSTARPQTAPKAAFYTAPPQRNPRGISHTISTRPRSRVDSACKLQILG